MKPTALILGILFSGAAFCQTPANLQDVSLNDFLEETQISSEDPDKLQICWWVPTEFWELSFAQDNTMSKREIEDFLSVLRPYQMVAVIDGVLGPFGGVTYTPEEKIAGSLTMYDKNDKEYLPIKERKLSTDIQNLLVSIKPMLKNMMGAMGENMHFYVFSDEAGKGRVNDPLEKGGFRITFMEDEYQFKTPISSLLEKKKCPDDGELMNGGWNYCPHHGTKLIQKDK